MDDYPKTIEGLWQRIAELQEQLEQERRKNDPTENPDTKAPIVQCRRKWIKKSKNPSTTAPNAAKGTARIRPVP